MSVIARKSAVRLFVAEGTVNPAALYPEVDKLASTRTVGCGGGDFLTHSPCSWIMCGTVLVSLTPVLDMLATFIDSRLAWFVPVDTPKYPDSAGVDTECAPCNTSSLGMRGSDGLGVAPTSLMFLGFCFFLHCSEK